METTQTAQRPCTRGLGAVAQGEQHWEPVLGIQMSAGQQGDELGNQAILCHGPH